MLSGYKTYIVGIVTVLGAVGGYLDGDLMLQAALMIAIPAIMGMTVRHGISTTAAKQ